MLYFIIISKKCNSFAKFCLYCYAPSIDILLCVFTKVKGLLWDLSHFSNDFCAKVARFLEQIYFRTTCLLRQNVLYYIKLWNVFGQMNGRCVPKTKFFSLWDLSPKRNYAKIWQMTVEATIPATSAASAANKIPLVFFIPTQLVYIPIV